MRESWRWFGPNDPVTLENIRQTGATDVVSALHDVPIGEIWTVEAIRNHQALIENTPEGLRPLSWSVVESIPIHEDIKLAKPGHEKYVQTWIDSMVNLARCGIRTICYNFMPVIDWTRTDLDHRLPSGARALHEGVVGTGFSHRVAPARSLEILRRLLDAGGMYQRNGSGALMIAYVAAGRLIAYHEHHINAWDALAGLALVREVGGWSSDFLAGDGLTRGNELAVCAPGVCEAFRALVEM